MRILIASDLHGSMTSLQFLAGKARKMRPDMIVLLGDLVYHGPRNPLPEGYDTASILENMRELADAPCPLLAVRGNCDADVDAEQMPFPMPESGWIMADGLNIYACHGHRIPENPPICGLRPGTVILRGHTHAPRAENTGGFQFWNPGSLSLPKQGYPRSYGIYENGVFRALDMEGNELLRSQ